MPSGPGQDGIRKIMLDAQKLLESHPVNLERRSAGEKPANWIWPWGQGKPPTVEPITRRFGVRGSVVAEVDLIRPLRCRGKGDALGLQRANPS